MKIIEPVVNISRNVGGNKYSSIYATNNSVYGYLDDSLNVYFEDGQRQIVQPSEYWVNGAVYELDDIVYHNVGPYVGRFRYNSSTSGIIEEPDLLDTGVWDLVLKCVSLHLEQGVYIQEASYNTPDLVNLNEYLDYTDYLVGSLVKYSSTGDSIWKSKNRQNFIYDNLSTTMINAGDTVETAYTIVTPDLSSSTPIAGTVGYLYICLVAHVPSSVPWGEHPQTDPTRWKLITVDSTNPLYNEHNTWEWVGYQNHTRFAVGDGGGRSYGYEGLSSYRDWAVYISALSGITTTYELNYTTTVPRIAQQNQKEVSGIYLYDMVGVDNVKVVVWDRDTGFIKFNNTFPISTSATEGVNDWFNFYFKSYEPEDYTERGISKFIEIPFSNTYECTIEFLSNDSSKRRGVGFIGLGWVKDVGITNYGSSSNIQDYSLKTTDDFGNTSIVERGYRDLIDYDITVPLNQTPALKRLLARNRAYPLIFIGDSEGSLDNTNTIGFYKDFSIPLSDYSNSYATIEVESL